MKKLSRSFVRGGWIFGFLAASGVTAFSQATTLYWEPASGIWSPNAGNANWSTTTGGTADTDWINNASAPYTDAVIEAVNPTITVAAGTTNVGTLTVQNGATFAQAAAGSFLFVYGGGSGNVTMSATASQLQMNLNGTSAWAGTFTLNTSTSSSFNILRINTDTATSTATKLIVNAGSVLVGTPTASNAVIGELSGSSSLGIVRSNTTTDATLEINQATNTTYAGVIGGTLNGTFNLSLTKSGSGALTLSGDVNHRGKVAVNEGSLYFNGTSTTNAISAVTVASGAILGGNGLIGIGGGTSRNVTVSSGGIIAPGGVSSIGTLTIKGNTGTNGSAVTSAGLIFSGSARIDVRLGALGTNDKIVLTGGGTNFGRGSASGGASSILFDFTNFNGEAQLGTYDLITFANTPGIAATAFGLTSDSIADGWAGTFAYSGNILQFTATSLGSIPEPSTYALLTGVVAFGAILTRRRNRR